MISSRHEQTIVAQCTPIGSGAIAVIRLSGKDALSLATQISRLASGKSLSEVPSHTIQYGCVVDSTGTLIDQVLFFVMHGPKTFTGEDTVEISCHNNMFIIEAIIAQVIAQGGRLAQNGEFTQRAVLHNKIDLLQAEAIQELLSANTQHTLKKSLAQLTGTFSHTVHIIEESLIHALALSEASFEFLDEEYLEFSNQIRQQLTHVLEKISQLTAQSSQQQHIRNGFKIAIIGSVNAGKSSLFNSLIGSSRAIVSPLAGTTRDSIEAGLYKNGTYWTLTDTAGLRTTDNSIEQEGIARSLEQAHLADLIILACDSSRALESHELDIYQELLEKYPSKIIPVLTKTDLSSELERPEFLSNPILVSSVTGHGIDTLKAAIGQKLEDLCQQNDSPFLLNTRHYNLLITLERELLHIMPLLKLPRIPFEIVSLHLREAIAQIAQLTGKSVSEAAMDAVFKSFCVGK